MSFSGEPRVHRIDDYLFHQLVSWWKLTPGRITGIYLLFGFVALYFSDYLLVQWFADPELTQLQALKGSAEVVVTGVLIFGLLSVKESQVARSQGKVGRQREELLVLHRVLRHNLRNDLNVIIGSSEMISEISDFEKTRQWAETVTRAGEKMLHYTRQAERIRNVTEQNGTTVDLDLARAVPKLVDGHPTNTDDTTLVLDLPDYAPVEVNQMFEEGLNELIHNAVVHNDSPTPRIEISVDPTAGPIHLVEISIADNGPGIPDDVISILGGEESDQLTHLQGMGLWFVTWVVSASDGRMEFDVSDEGGSVVTIQVPTSDFLSQIV